VNLSTPLRPRGEVAPRLAGGLPCGLSRHLARHLMRLCSSLFWETPVQSALSASQQSHGGHLLSAAAWVRLAWETLALHRTSRPLP
jgi:hypothetical protein